MKRTLLQGSAFIFSLSFFTPSFSQINTLCISGTVNRIEDQKNLLTGIVQLDDPFEGTIKYDLSIADNNILPQVGDYHNTSSLSGIHIEIGNQVFETQSNNVDFLVETVDNYYSQDNIVFRSYNNSFTPVISGTFSETHISWQLDDTSETAISTIDIPSSISIEDWQQPFALTITGSNHYGYPYSSILIRGAVTAVSSCPNKSILSTTNPYDENKLNIHPNPFQHTATLQFNSSLNNATVAVYTLQGNKVLNYDQVSGSSFTISREQLSNGVYLVQLMKEDGSFSTAKVMIADK